MPIKLDDIQSVAQARQKIYSPKFFDQKLTGRGGHSTVGLLSMKHNPASVQPTAITRPEHYQMHKHSFPHGQTRVTKLPLDPLSYNARAYMKVQKRPDVPEVIQIGTYKKSPLYMHMQAQALTLEETTYSGGINGGTTTTRVFTPCYSLTFYSSPNQNVKEHKLVDSFSYMANYANGAGENTYTVCYGINPVNEWLSDWYQKLTSAGFKIQNNIVTDYFMQYDLYDGVARRSEEWQTNIAAVLDEYLENITTYYPTDAMALAVIENEMKYIMDYKIPLHLYRDIYQSVMKHFPAKTATQICKQNLNLLLSDTLHNLDANKPSLVTFTQPNPPVQLPASVAGLNKEQTSAVISNDPLILVQSGAGTGKSTLILGRIDYLCACGVKPEDITVLSFTNAAANHINNKCPKVNSMTIAKMIHTIYETNFTGHELSRIETIRNSLDIYFPKDVKTHGSLVNRFSRMLKSVLNNDTNSFTEMSNFVEDNYDDVIRILDTIKQTSLELEIIICYLRIDTFKEPKGVQSKFLIIDEVQDNSIFEFVYTLKYVDKHKESLFIVGDSSQTLYEFRASNPRALNILEGSGTFSTYQLNINYRSNQEILDFANIALQNIEANQYANIQLHANSFAKVTEQSFLDKVKFNYQRLPKVSGIHDALPTIIAKEVAPYIRDCLAKGEQVAFLAFTRKELKKIDGILEHQFPGVTRASLVSEKMHDITTFSTFIMKYWDEVKMMPVNQIYNAIGTEIVQRLPELVGSSWQKAHPAVSKLIDEWKNDQSAVIDAWSNQVAKGQMTHKQFLTAVQENMLQFEIKKNAIKQALLSSQNELAKQSDTIANANILLSTIHGAKGLEFDNVVVLYRNENALDEEKKRMYYVAFTRAIKSEYILAYDTVVSPQIQADYNTVLEKLHNISPAATSPVAAIPKDKRIRI